MTTGTGEPVFLGFDGSAASFWRRWAGLEYPGESSSTIRGRAGRRTVTAPANEPYPFPLEESLVIAVDSSAVAVCVSPGEHLPAHPLRAAE